MNRILIIKSAVFASLLIASCSVKEDRRACPCILRVDFSDCQRFPEERLFFQITSEISKEDFKADFSASAIPEICDVLVSKGLKAVSAFMGVEGCELAGTKLTALDGRGFDPLFLYKGIVPCWGERASDTVKLRKEFAEIAVEMVDPENRKYPLSIFALSPVKGIDVISSKPVTGEMKVKLLSDKDKACLGEWKPLQNIDTTGRSNRIFRVIVPRQIDASLVLDILYENGKLIDSLPIGQMLLDASYNWSAPDLADVFIRSDSYKSKISLIISDWRTGSSEEFVI